MRHRRRTRRLGRTTPHKKAMMRNMVTSLLKHGRISTTVTRAKELRRLADRMITLGKNGSLHARRQALSVIMEKAVVARLFDDIAPACMERNGGYTRIMKTAPRRGDASLMCIIELVTGPVSSSPEQDNVHDSQDRGSSAAVSSVIPEASDSLSQEDAKQTVEVAPESEDVSTAASDSEVEGDASSVTVAGTADNDISNDMGVAEDSIQENETPEEKK